MPQEGFDRRPEFHEFIDRLLDSIREAAIARQRSLEPPRDPGTFLQPLEEDGEAGACLTPQALTPIVKVCRMHLMPHLLSPPYAARPPTVQCADPTLLSLVFECDGRVGDRQHTHAHIDLHTDDLANSWEGSGRNFGEG